MSEELKPCLKINDIEHESNCAITDFTYRDMASTRDCTCGAAINWYEIIIQAIFDPENQPSQFGTCLISSDHVLIKKSDLDHVRETLILLNSMAFSSELHSLNSTQRASAALDLIDEALSKLPKGSE
jgi:hypothetical protein